MKAAVTSQYVLTNSNSWHYSYESSCYFTMCTHQLQQLTLLQWKQQLLYNVYSPTPAADITPMKAVVTSQCVLTNSSSWHYSNESSSYFTMCTHQLQQLTLLQWKQQLLYNVYSPTPAADITPMKAVVTSQCVLTDSSSWHYSYESSSYFTMCTHQLQQLTLLLWKQQLLHNMFYLC